jgi:hypothetical protein
LLWTCRLGTLSILLLLLLLLHGGISFGKTKIKGGVVTLREQCIVTGTCTSAAGVYLTKLRTFRAAEHAKFYLLQRTQGLYPSFPLLFREKTAVKWTHCGFFVCDCGSPQSDRLPRHRCIWAL